MSVADHVDDLAAGYTLGALEPEEIERVERHLPHCPTCRQAIADAREVADMLAYAAPMTTPPPLLRASVLRRTRREAPPPAIRFPAWRGWQPALVAASLVLAVGMGALTMLTQQQLQVERAQVQLLAPKATQEARLMTMLLSPAATTLPMRATTTPVTATAGRLVIDQQEGMLMLVVRALPALPADRAYQVWLARDGERRPAGLFRTDAAGAASLEMPLPSDLGTYRWVWITVEPAGGSPAPTGAVVLGASL